MLFNFPAVRRRAAVNLKSPYLVRLLRQQFIYVALAAVVGGIVWANRLDINPVAVIVYTLTIANLMTIPLEALRFLYWDEPFPRNWVIYVGLMLVLMVPVYIVATVLVYWLAPPETPDTRAFHPNRVETSHPDHDRLRDGGFPLRHDQRPAGTT